MKLFRSVLPVLALTVPVTAADFYMGIRAVLPPAQKAEAAPEAPAVEPAAPAPQVAETPAAESAAQPEPAAPAYAELSYTEDAAPVADVSPAAHAAEYARFCELLKVQAEQNLYDFCPSMEVVLSTTQDPFAVETWMQKAADDGCAAAQQYVADLRLINVRMDALQTPEVKAAYALARKSADAGYTPAQVNVYMCLKNGVGVPKDEKGAEAYFLKACKGGGFIPRFKWLQLSGRLTQFSDRERPEVKAEVERGNAYVMYCLARMADTTAERFDWLRQAGERGNGDALFDLSAMVSESDPETSFELLKEAIKCHNAEAMYTLGTALVEGHPEDPVMKAAGLHHDDKAGRHLMKLAGMLGNIRACFWLGHVCHDGVFGVKQDDAAAYRWFEKGARMGSMECAASQGIMLLTGRGVQEDAKQGLMLLNGAANAGSSHAVQGLAYALYAGKGVPQDARKAADILQEAAAMGNPEAYVYLAYVTAQGGAGLTADARSAAHYVDLAALDMKEEAHKLYDKLTAQGWTPEP